MTDRDDWMTTRDTAQVLSINPTTVTSWARSGRIAGSVKDDRDRWLIPRPEVERVLTKRERALERRLARWTPMSERTTASGYGPLDEEGHHA